MENRHFVSADLCVCLEHLWLAVSGFKEQRGVGKAERETTSENEDNNCFSTKRSHTHGLTKAPIVIEEQNHNKNIRPYTSTEHYSVCIVYTGCEIVTAHGSIT